MLLEKKISCEALTEDDQTKNTFYSCLCTLALLKNKIPLTCVEIHLKFTEQGVLCIDMVDLCKLDHKYKLLEINCLNQEVNYSLLNWGGELMQVNADLQISESS